MTTSDPTHGSIVHIELYTDDKDATRAFYGKVFGWSFEDVPGMDYTMWRAPNPPNGGLMERQEGPFQPPPTMVYLNVDDLGATREKIQAAGGEVLVEEIEVPEMGLFCVFKAPGGVVQAAWEDTYEGEPPEGGWPKFTDEGQPGSYCHVELYSADPEATQAFYSEVFDWQFDQAEEIEYIFTKPPTPPYGGLLQAGEHMPPGTLPYLLVTSAEETCQAVEAAGGQVLREPFDVEGHGRMAVFQAPGGIVQALWEAI